MAGAQTILKILFILSKNYKSENFPTRLRLARPLAIQFVHPLLAFYPHSRLCRLVDIFGHRP